jgi:hypothetical protein
MTTRVHVEANAGKPVRVVGADPVSGEEAFDRVLAVGEAESFYVHAGLSVTVHEVQPEPEGTE